MLTGEYVVLDGATALAVPTRFGQNLHVKSSKNPEIHWRSYDEKGGIWFSDVFCLDRLISIKNDRNPISQTLTNILHEARNLNPKFLSKNNGLEVSTRMNFPRDWGLGSSSTLINNIAQWAEVDAFKLLDNSFGGSGYDIAAAQNNVPLLYQREKDNINVIKTQLDWNFSDSIFFVHLNKKQNSREGIAHYRKFGVDEKITTRISEISLLLPHIKTLEELESLLEEHEYLIAKTINLPRIQTQYFSDYRRCVKSLGAWGGDFILATGNKTDQEYFKRKGYKTIIPFKEMVKPTG